MASLSASIIHLALCQAVDPPSPSDVGDKGAAVLRLLAVLVCIVIVGIGGLVVVRRWLRRSEDTSVGFSLSDLRDMHAAGDLTDGEFHAARDAMVAHVKERMSAGSKGETKYTRKKNT
ncbi:MAG: hypothetical protein EXS17_00900 [Phycisphaerales bacterium]|nr:hypothetical protein [Phycisphaerales bacterium]